MAAAYQSNSFQNDAFQVNGAEPAPTPAPVVVSNNFGGGGIPLAHELFYEAWERLQRKKLENEDDWIIGWAVSDDDP